MIKDDAILQAAAWAAQGRRVALATVVSAWEAAFRPAGAMMAVADDGACMGEAAAGDVQAAVVHEALKCLEDGEPRLLRFDVSDGQAWRSGLACGGKMEIYVEPLEDSAP